MQSRQNVGAYLFVAAMAVVSSACLASSLSYWQFSDPTRFTCYLIVAILASSLKVSLPGIEGTLSVNFLFTLLGIVELSFGQTLLIGLASTAVQFYWKPARTLKPVQLIFNISQVTVSSAAAYGAYKLVVLHVLHAPGPLALLAAAMVHFACNTGAMSTIIGLTENKSIRQVWTSSYLWSFPYYLVGAASAGLVHLLNRYVGWQSSLLALPPIYLMYRSYRLYLEKLHNEKRHAQRLSSVHLRTIETLALAIEAKDKTTGEHLQRVRVYAMDLAKELGLSEDETEALRAASVLHDIGKLAVPEHIISKPGKLTPEEFEKMKIHPIVGAEILEQVDFPYPVVPIVRAHHEKWDGTGYPYGLKGEEIPIGARILSAVDCLDAMASDRQYRKAMPLDEAMAKVTELSGKSYDPQVVAILGRRYVALEKLAKELPTQTTPKLSTDIKIECGLAPGVGFAESAPVLAESPNSGRNLADSIDCARKLAADILELSRQPNCSLDLDELLSILSLRLGTLVLFDALAVYRPVGNVLLPKFVTGENSRMFSSLRIPMGIGLAGWVAENYKSISNGNPTVEPGYTNDPGTLRAALAVPLVGPSGDPWVLSLYRTGENSFTETDLLVIEAMSEGIAALVHSSKKPRVAGIAAAVAK